MIAHVLVDEAAEDAGSVPGKGHLYRAPIADGVALAMETARFRDIYNSIRLHRALDDRTPRQAYLDTRRSVPLKARSPRRGTGRVLRDIPSSSWPATALGAAPVPVEVHM